MSPALFIDVRVDDSVAHDPELAAKLAEVCPVDIFRSGAGGFEIVPENLDECVLCQLCLNAAPAGSARDQALRRRGAARDLTRRGNPRRNTGVPAAARSHQRPVSCLE